MTREEAIDRLKEARAGHKEFLSIETLNMAIKALEQEPCGDVVSRQAVLDIVDSYSESRSNVEDVAQDIISDIMALPPVTPQKIGHWKRISIDKYSEHAKYWYRCDRCGEDNLGDTDWCPNCGCRMG